MLRPKLRKSLIPTQKPNHVDYKRYKGKRILKFEFVCTINNGDCDTRWFMSFCLLTCMGNLLGMIQTKYLIRPITTIITIMEIKNKTRKWTPSLIINSLTHVYVSAGTITQLAQDYTRTSPIGPNIRDLQETFKGLSGD